MFRTKDVAPLAGSVDRNRTLAEEQEIMAWSLPSRGAWIEIRYARRRGEVGCVAPLAGSVDRNHNA